MAIALLKMETYGKTNEEEEKRSEKQTNNNMNFKPGKIDQYIV